MPRRGDPIREWREGYARRWLYIDYKPLSDAPFRASVEPIFDEPIFDDLRIARTTLSPGVTFRDEELVKDGENSFALLTSCSKDLVITHHGRDLRLGRGDATLLHLCITGSVGSRQEFSYIPLIIPHAELEARVVHVSDAVMQRLPQRSEAMQLMRAYIRALERGRLN